MECIPPLTAFATAPTLSCAAITDPGTENLPHGESCTLACPAGFKAVDGSPALACEKGVLRGCLDTGCTELQETLPMCVPAGATYRQVDAIRTGIVATTVGANFLAEKEALGMQKFGEALHSHIIITSEQESTVSITALEITEMAAEPSEDARRIQDDARRALTDDEATAPQVPERDLTDEETTAAPGPGTTEAPPTLAPAQRLSKVYAPALVVPASGAGDADDPESGFGAVYDVIQLLATEPTASKEFKTGLQAALLNSFPLVVVEDVVIDAPRMTKTWVEIPGVAVAPTPPPTEPEEETVGWGEWLIDNLFLIIVMLPGVMGLVGLGQHMYKKQKEKEAAAAGEGAPLTGGADGAAEADGERGMV